jgi:NADPH:quinone reductase-like Zn-dependent oxidoreductase
LDISYDGSSVAARISLKEMLGSQASTISQLGGTALRMVRDFVTLQPGEVVLQNAGNSAVGFMASQLGSAILSMSVVSLCRRGSRSKEQWEELVQYLMTEGKCARVVAEEA